MNAIVKRISLFSHIQRQVLAAMTIAVSVFWMGVTIAVPLDKLDHIVIMPVDSNPIIIPKKNEYGFAEELTGLELLDIGLCNANTSCQQEALDLGAEYFDEQYIEGVGLVVAYYDGNGKLVGTKLGGRPASADPREGDEYVVKQAAPLPSISERDIQTEFHSSDSDILNDKPVGFIEGNFAVSPMGAATYDIPIAVPPGSAGVQPEISVSYTSQGGRGTLGQGWSLSGFSSISRCPKTIALDGFYEGVNLDENDNYCLDGQRLIETGSSEGITFYRLEIDNYSQIKGFDNNGDGEPEYFNSRTKAGEIIEYGNTENARFKVAGNKVLTWGINELRDKKRNYIHYEYLHHSSGAGKEFLPWKIHYTGNETTQLEPYAHVILWYGHKPIAHRASGYIKGTQIGSTRRMERITVELHSDESGRKFTKPIREYKFSYFSDSPSSVHRQSRLWNIEECAINSSNKTSCLPKTWFKWDGKYGSNNRTENPEGVQSLTSGLPQHQPNETDFKPSEGGKREFTNLPDNLNKYGWNQGYSSTNSHKLIGDIDGDGLSDTLVIRIVDISPPVEGLSPNLENEEDADNTNVVVFDDRKEGFTNETDSLNKDIKAQNIPIGMEIAKEDINIESTTDTTPENISLDVGINNKKLEVGVVLATGLSSGTGFDTSGFDASEANYETYLQTFLADDYPRFLSDVDGDGLSDLVSIDQSKVLVALSTGSSFLPNIEWLGDGYFAYSQGWRAGKNPRFLQDMNGDGRADLVGSGVINGEDGVHVSLSTGSGFLPPEKWSAHFGRTRVNEYYHSWDYTNPNTDIQLVDISGDGLPDIVGFTETYISVAINRLVTVRSKKTRRFILRSTNGLFGIDLGHPRDTSGNLIRANIDTPRTTGDINGDGLADIVAFFRDGVHIAYSTGNAFKPFELKKSYFGIDAGNWHSHHQRHVVDINGDGRADILGFGSPDIYVSLSSGNDTLGFAHKWQDGPDGNWSKPEDIRSFGDLNGDGLVDIINIGKYGVFSALNMAEPQRISNIIIGGYLPSGEEEDFAGLHRNIIIAYDKLTSEGGHYDPRPSGMRDLKGKGIIDIRPALFVVTSHYNYYKKLASAGSTATAEMGYQYGGLKADRNGRGLMGFYERTAIDGEGLVSNVLNLGATRTRSIYHQEFPLNGRAYFTETKVKAEDETTFKLIGSTYDTYSTNKSNEHDYYSPYISISTESTFSLNGTTPSNSLYKVVTSESGLPDRCGNVKLISVTTKGIKRQKEYTKTTRSHYPYDNNCFNASRLAWSEVTHEAPNVANITKKSSFYYTNLGQIEKEVIHDLDGQGQNLSLTTEYDYDDYGNVIRKSVSGYRLGNRYTTTEYDHNAVNQRGRFATRTTNALGHTETRTYDSRFGTVKDVTGPNGLTTRMRYNAFGQKFLEIAPNNSYVHTRYEWINGERNSSNSRYKIHTSTSNNSFKRTFYDHLDRAIRVVSSDMKFSDKLVYTEKYYRRSTGDLLWETLPFYSDATSSKVSYDYDVLKRPTKITQPDGSFATVTYNGLTTTTKDAEGNTKTEKRTVWGKPERVTDAHGNTVSYTYTADGNLKETKVSANTRGGQTGADTPIIVTSFNYDSMGNKESMNDPDMGGWYYTYNAAGELLSQQNVRGAITRLEYDDLGRMTSRENRDENTTWVYDIGSGKGKGKVANITSTGGINKTFGYTNFGQVASTTETLPDLKGSGTLNYTTRNIYDKFGRLDVLLIPSDNPKHPIALKHHYHDSSRSGVLHKITDDRKGMDNKVYWELNDTNAAGNILSQTLGNGLTSTRGYDKLNRVTRITTPGRQSLTYKYDKLGNLTQRKNNRINVVEDFLYDNLDRLIQSKTQYANITTPVTKNIKYDGHGNITQKDGKAYQYRNSHKHAVSKIGNVTYGYDTNGNMTSGGGRSTQWASFDKPSKITKTQSGGKKKEITLAYDAGRNRIRKTSTDTTTGGINRDTLYVAGGLMERERITSGNNAGAEVYKYHLKAGGQNIGYITQHWTQYGDLNAENTRYLLNDHLGSVDVITNASGQKIKSLSFSAWGERRKDDWKAANDSDLDNLMASLNQESMKLGFTGHEHDDEVGLINMKGRLYDAKIGRFISADPNIQAPTDTQSYNRYTYVKNNPLSYTDPSGYFFKKIFKKIGRFFKKYGRTILALGASILTGGALLAAYGPIGAGFAGGFVGGVISTGSLKGAIRGGLFGALSAGLSFGVGHGGLDGGSIFGLGDVGTAVAHGVAQGAVNVLRGGKFGSGFLSGFAGKVSGMFTKGMSKLGQVTTSVMVGGTVSAMSGGKFANGAVTAAFVTMFNDWYDNFRSEKPVVIKPGTVDKRAYAGSGMAGWKEAGLSGHSDSQLSVGVGATADVFLFAVGASGEIATRAHGDLVCVDVGLCGQVGIGLHAGAGLTMTTGVENISTDTSGSLGAFGNFFAGGASANTDFNGSASGTKGSYGVGAGASTGVQACISTSIICR